MSGSEFDRKAKVVATAWEVLDGNPQWKAEWKTILEHFDLGFPYAWLHYMGHGTLNDEGKDQVEATYGYLLKALEVEDSEDFETFWDILAQHNKEK